MAGSCVLERDGVGSVATSLPEMEAGPVYSTSCELSNTCAHGDDVLALYIFDHLCVLVLRLDKARFRQAVVLVDSPLIPIPPPVEHLVDRDLPVQRRGFEDREGAGQVTQPLAAAGFRVGAALDRAQPVELL